MSWLRYCCLHDGQVLKTCIHSKAACFENPVNNHNALKKQNAAAVTITAWP